MEVLQLQILSADETLPHALRLLKRGRQGGLAVRQGSDLWLVTAGVIVQSMAKGLGTLGEVEPRTRIHRSEGADASRPRVEFGVTDGGERGEANRPPSRSAGRHAYVTAGSVGAARTSIRVETPHLEFARVLRLAPEDCYCTNPAQKEHPHSYSKPLPADGKCLYDDFPIVCS